MGARNVPLAKKYARTILVLGLFIAFIVSLLMYMNKENIVGLFTEDKVLVDLLLGVMPIYLCFNLSDSMLMAF